MQNEFVPGLPSRTEYAPISQSGRTRLVIQKHVADRAGKHYDMRLKDGNKAHSWVIKALPGERDKMLAVHQPTHTAKYMDFQGKIESGYGAGTVTKAYDKKVRVLSANNDRIKMVLPEGTFTMIKPKGFGDKNWLMIKNAAYIDELEKIAGKNLYENLWAGGNKDKHNKLVLKWIDLLNQKNPFNVSKMANEAERIRNLKILERMPKIKNIKKKDEL